MFSISPFLKVALIIATSYSRVNTVNSAEDLSCTFNHDFCGWSTKMESMNPSEFDIGWRIYSPHLDGHQIPLPDNRDRFVLATGQDDSRSFLISPQSSSSPAGFSVTFNYLTTGTASLSLYLFRDSGYKYIWPPTVEDTESYDYPIADGDNTTVTSYSQKETGESQIDAWKTASLRSICEQADVSSFFQLTFVAYTKPNETVALSNVVTTRLKEIPEECLYVDDNDNETQENIDTSAAWKFFIIFTLFLCFGAVLVAALLIIGKSTKTIYVPPNIERTQEFENPSFKYRKLREIETI